MGLPEIKFRYPPASDREKDLFKRATDKLNEYPFLMGFYWCLVDEPNYKTFMQACSEIPGCRPDPVFVPEEIIHGNIYFAVNIRFDGFRQEDKERLTGLLADTGIHPSFDSLELSYQISAEREKLYGPPDPELLAREERRTFARNLSFHTEE